MAFASEELRKLLADLARERGERESELRYAIELKAQIEYHIDRAPVDEAARRTWVTIHPSEETRIKSVIHRYSYCFPFFSAYAVRTRFVASRGSSAVQEDDRVIYDKNGLAAPLTRKDIAWILGMNKGNCNAGIRRMEEKHVLRFNEAGRCFLLTKPEVLAGERPLRSVQISKSEPLGLPKIIADQLVASFAPLPEDVRTDLFRAALGVRKDFLETLKNARYREKEGYENLCTQARHLLLLQKENSDARNSSSSAADTAIPETTTLVEESGLGRTVPQPEANTDEPRVNESHGFAARLVQIFVAGGKPAPNRAQIAQTTTALPAEAQQPYLDELQAKIDRIQHPGVLATDVAAFLEGWPVKHARQIRKQSEAKALRQRDQALVAEHEQWIKKEVLPDRFADAEVVARILEENPELRDYTPPAADVRAIDVGHVRRALAEISRKECPPEIKEEHRRRLAELEQISPGIVDEVIREDSS